MGKLPRISEDRARELQLKAIPHQRALVLGPRQQWMGTNGIRYKLTHG